MREQERATATIERFAALGRAKLLLSLIRLGGSLALPNQKTNFYVRNRDSAEAADPGFAGCERKDLARFLDFGRNTLVFDQFDEIGGRKRSEGRVQEVPLVAIRPNDAPLVGRLREVAPRPARHQDFYARAAIFLNQKRPPA